MKQNQRPLFITMLCLLCLIFLSGCRRTPAEPSPGQTSGSNSVPGSPISKSSFKLNTIVTITIYDSQDTSLLDGALALCDTYEAMFSRTKQDSEIAQLNSGADITLSKDTLSLIQTGLDYAKLSDGAFDITIEPVSSLWDFTALSPKIPDSAAISSALKHVGWQKVQLNGSKLQLSDPAMGIDPGAIAKGYIADRIKDYLLEHGVKSALINLGGNLLLVGTKPDGANFKIGIQKPFKDRNESVAIMELSDVSIVSSGIYERYFIQEDTLYHHILNPATGYPYDTGLIAVTVITNASVDGDALSTAAFALGLEKGMELINSLEDVYAVFITEDDNLHYSEGFLEAIPVTPAE